MIKSKFIKPKDKYPPDTFAHIPNIAMLNSIENQLYKIYAKDHAPKNYFSYQNENISKPNQNETGGLASIFQIRLNARLKLIVNVD